MAQTAVEWLQMQMATCSPQEMVENINVWFKEAKEIEKEQIKEAYLQGDSDAIDNPRRSAEQYYNETFGNK